MISETREERCDVTVTGGIVQIPGSRGQCEGAEVGMYTICTPATMTYSIYMYSLI